MPPERGHKQRGGKRKRNDGFDFLKRFRGTKHKHEVYNESKALEAYTSLSTEFSDLETNLNGNNRNSNFSFLPRFYALKTKLEELVEQVNTSPYAVDELVAIRYPLVRSEYDLENGTVVFSDTLVQRQREIHADIPDNEIFTKSLDLYFKVEVKTRELAERFQLKFIEAKQTCEHTLALTKNELDQLDDIEKPLPKFESLMRRLSKAYTTYESLAVTYSSIPEVFRRPVSNETLSDDYQTLIKTLQLLLQACALLEVTTLGLPIYKKTLKQLYLKFSNFGTLTLATNQESLSKLVNDTLEAITSDETHAQTTNQNQTSAQEQLPEVGYRLSDFGYLLLYTDKAISISKNILSLFATDKLIDSNRVSLTPDEFNHQFQAAQAKGQIGLLEYISATLRGLNSEIARTKDTLDSIKSEQNNGALTEISEYYTENDVIDACEQGVIGRNMLIVATKCLEIKRLLETDVSSAESINSLRERCHALTRLSVDNHEFVVKNRLKIDILYIQMTDLVFALIENLRRKIRELEEREP